MYMNGDYVEKSLCYYYCFVRIVYEFLTAKYGCQTKEFANFVLMILGFVGLMLEDN